MFCRVLTLSWARWAGALAGLAACAPSVPRGPVAVERAAAPAVLVVQGQPGAPTLHLQAVLRVGSAWDPPGQEGLAALMARGLVAGGAGGRSPAQVQAALDQAGAQVELVVDRELTALRMRCPPAQAPVCAELFVDLIVRPGFAPAAIEGLAASGAAGLGALSGPPLAQALGEAALYQAHPYGHPPDGRVGSLGLLGAAEVRAFHAARVRRATVAVGLGGPVDADLAGAVAQGLADLPAGLPGELPLPRPIRPIGRGLIAADTGQPTTVLQVVHGLELGSDAPDGLALAVGLAAHSSPDPRLQAAGRALRRAWGMGWVEPALGPTWQVLPGPLLPRRQGQLAVQVGPVPTAQAPAALAGALRALDALAEGGLTEAQVQRGVAALRERLAGQAEDPARRLAHALQTAMTGAPDPLDARSLALDSLRTEAVNAALSAHLRPRDLWIVAVGGDVGALADRLLEGDPEPVVHGGAPGLGLDPSRVHVLPASGVFR